MKSFSRPRRTQRRRRMLAYSLPVVLIALLVIGKLLTVTIAGTVGAHAYSAGSYDRALTAARVAAIANVVEPYKAFYNAGVAHAGAGKLVSGRREFERALDLANGPAECRVRVNLVVTIEAQGDAAAPRHNSGARAAEFYRDALQVAGDAPEDCLSLTAPLVGLSDDLRKTKKRLTNKLAKSSGQESKNEKSTGKEPDDAHDERSDSRQEQLKRRSRDGAEDRAESDARDRSLRRPPSAPETKNW